MDWRSVKFDWNRARAFLVTAEEGSLSAAARALDMAQPTLGRQVSALESELGVLLFDRIGKRLELTAAGVQLLDHVRAMGDAASRVSLAASGQSATLAGHVCVSASESFASHLLPPIIAALRRDEPGITVELLASDSLSDLRRREADIAVRNARPSDPELIARRLPDQAARFYATPEYLERIGQPSTSAALSHAEFIGFVDNAAYCEGLRNRGIDVDPRRSFPLTTASHLVHWQLVKAGAGIGIMAERIGDAEPGVCRAAPWLEPFRFPVWLVTHREIHTSRRIRRVFDRLAGAIAALSEPD